jgi:hypothetical protein
MPQPPCFVEVVINSREQKRCFEERFGNIIDIFPLGSGLRFSSFSPRLPSTSLHTSRLEPIHHGRAGSRDCLMFRALLLSTADLLRPVNSLGTPSKTRFSQNFLTRKLIPMNGGGSPISKQKNSGYRAALVSVILRTDRHRAGRHWSGGRCPDRHSAAANGAVAKNVADLVSIKAPTALQPGSSQVLVEVPCSPHLQSPPVALRGSERNEGMLQLGDQQAFRGRDQCTP